MFIFVVKHGPPVNPSFLGDQTRGWSIATMQAVPLGDTIFIKICGSHRGFMN